MDSQKKPSDALMVGGFVLALAIGFPLGVILSETYDLPFPDELIVLVPLIGWFAYIQKKGYVSTLGSDAWNDSLDSLSLGAKIGLLSSFGFSMASAFFLLIYIGLGINMLKIGVAVGVIIINLLAWKWTFKQVEKKVLLV